ncbi:tape measure protein [Achromobacter sp. Bel]|uniref:tape measure protein n=1 Tax=Achromobacter sp. Bel TaxID=2727415 RepID=UPI00145F3477|nr:tape measure protein [Achromobacter sp. Bel]NMK48055.1 phage tail tape measure protein [Achromobacter sp. Bel]
MTVVRELVTLLRYQADDSGLKPYWQAFEGMLAAMTRASVRASAAMRGAFSGVLAHVPNVPEAVNDLAPLPRQGMPAARQRAPLLGGLRGVVQLSLGDAPIKRILSDIDAWAQTQLRLRQVAGGDAQYAQADRKIAQVSRSSRTPYAQNVDTYARTQQVLEDQGRSTQHAASVTEALALSMTLSGTPAQDHGGVVASLLKMIEQNRLGLDEYNTLPRRMQDALAAGLGVNRSELREQVQGGHVTADRALPALQSQLPRMRAEAESAPASITGAMTVFNDAMQRYFGETLPGGRIALQAVTGAIQYLADNIGTVVKLLALAGASIGLVTMGNWLRQATILSGGLIQSLLAATRAALGLDTAMSLRRGPAGAMQMLSLWTRSLAPMLRMAAVLTTIYLIGEDIANWLDGGDSVLGGWIGGVEQWQKEFEAVSTAVAYVKGLLVGAGRTLGPWITQFGTIAVMAFGLWQILSPVGKVILSVATTAVPMLANALMYVAQKVIPMLWNAFAMTPIGRLISAITLLALALWQIWENWDVIKAYMSATWDELMAKANDSFLAPVMEYIAAIWAFWEGLVKGVVAAFTGDWDGAIAHWQGAFEGLWRFFSGMGGRMVATVKEIGNAIETWVLGKLKVAKSWFQDLLPDWMKSDENASVMDTPAGRGDMPPAWSGVIGGLPIPSVSAASVIGAGPNAGRASFMYQNRNDIVVNVTGADPQVARGAVLQGVYEGSQRGTDVFVQKFDAMPTVEANS